MAKVARQAAVKKASKAMPAPVKPVKQALTKSALVSLIAEENEIPRKTVAGVYATLEDLFLGSVHPRGVGEFVLPGLQKVSLRKVPARKAGTLIRNPSTGERERGTAGRRNAGKSWSRCRSGGQCRATNTLSPAS